MTSSSRSANIKSDEAPLAVEDDIYSIEPIIDKNVVVKIFELLSDRTYRCLQEDCKQNKRYARRMVISNQITEQQRLNNPRLRDHRRRDEIEVELPHDQCCWNDVKLIDVQLQMLYAISEGIDDDNYDNYEWFNVRIHLDQFICPVTRQVFLNDGTMVTTID